MNKEFKKLFENREIPQYIIDEARFIVDKAEKEATEWIKAMNTQIKNTNKHEKHKRTK
jgi:hypothetical protein